MVFNHLVFTLAKGLRSVFVLFGTDGRNEGRKKWPSKFENFETVIFKRTGPTTRAGADRSGSDQSDIG